MSEFCRILFVDNKVAVLDGLERSSFEMSEHRAMTVVQSAAEALKKLADEQFDRIVMDMRMPGKDGLTLLSPVYGDFPDVVRIVLTGHSEMEATLRAMPVAHRVAGKITP